MMEQEKDENKGGMVRAQSSLELLSQTAALKNDLEESSKEQSGLSKEEEQDKAPAPLENKQAHSRNLVETSKIASAAVSEQLQQISPYQGRVTPADSSCFLDRTRCSTLSLPEMAGGPVFLEQKRSFLPAPFEGTLHSSTDFENSPTYSPGLFLSYSNVSCGTTAGNSNNRTSNETNAGPSVATRSSGSDGSDNTLLGTASFSSGNGSTGSSFIPTLNPSTIAAGAPGSMQAAFVPPRPQLLQVQRVSSVQLAEQGDETQQLNADGLIRDNYFLRQQLAAKDATIDALQQQVASLQKEVVQLRQLPTGKISQIPIEEMLSLMREYGSEVSDTAMPPRKSYVQKASVVRQFRRWNPNFLQYFEFKDGSWFPKLGKAEELKRRHEARRLAAAKRKKQQGEKEALGKAKATAL